jgi:hypothetical protein
MRYSKMRFGNHKNRNKHPRPEAGAIIPDIDEMMGTTRI